MKCLCRRPRSFCLTSYKPAKNLIKLNDFLMQNIKKIKNDKYFNDELNFAMDLISSGNILNYVSKKIK